MLSLSSRQELKRDLRFALLATCVVGILAVSATVEFFKIVGTTGEYQDQTAESAAEGSRVRIVLLLMQEAELSARSYLLTGDSIHLAEFDRAKQRLAPELLEFSQAFADQDIQRTLSQRIASLVSNRIQRLSLLVTRHRTNSYEETEALRHDRTLQPLRTVRRLANELIAAKREEVASASAALDAEFDYSRNIMIGLMSSLILLVAGVAAAVLGYLTHRSRIEEQLVLARKSAEAANEAKSDFLASMSHEIRTPLTTILGYTELLADERLTRSQRESLKRIQTSGAGLLALVNDILDFSKIEAGEITLEEQPVSLAAIVSDVLEIASLDLKRNDICLIQEIDPALPERVLTDGTRLRQILLNLVSNATKFTEKGSVAVCIRNIGHSALGELIRFEVRDTGIGIAPENHDKLFQRFSQVDSSSYRKFGGTGLGLAISRKLVSLMNGEIDFDSIPGKGSTFWFVVPLQPAPELLQRDVVAVHAPPRASGHVLLVEDAPQNQELVRTMLDRAGYTVEVASDGQEALEAIAARDFDLVLMDMQLPRMSGLEATRRIRAMDGPTGETPIVALTANVLPEHLETFKRSGIDDHVGKPFRQAALVETVARWITHGPSRGRAASGASDALPIHDPASFEEARSLMGDEWVTACLRRLSENLAYLFEAGRGTGTSAAPVAEIGSRAHRMVSDAGQLGFPELSRRCADLEQACSRNRGVKAATRRTHEATLAVRNKIDALLLSTGETVADPEIRSPVSAAPDRR